MSLSFRNPKTLVAAILLGSTTIVGLMSAAVAHDDTGVMGFFSQPAQETERPMLRPTQAPEASGRLSMSALSNSERSRSHRVRIAKAARATRLVTREHHRQVVAGRTGDPSQAPFLTITERPSIIVSLYNDKTLRKGDAVMTPTGLRIFAGSQSFPFRTEDFTTLSLTKSLTGPLRKALVDYDQNPAFGRQS